MSCPSRLVRLAEVESSQLQSLWGGRIPVGALTLLDADPGSGKSSLLRDLTARVTTGRQFPFEEATMPLAGVVLLQAEDNLAATIAPALRAAGAYDKLIIALDSRNGGKISFPDHLGDIEEAVAAIKARLIIIDPVSEFVSSATLHDDQRIRETLRSLIDIAQRHDCGVIVSRHLTKRGAGNPMYRGRGSIGLVGLARSALMIGSPANRKDKYEHALVQYKGSSSDSPTLLFRTACSADGSIQIEWLATSEIGADEVMATESARQRSALHEACLVLVDILSHGALPADEVIKAAKRIAGVSKRTLQRAKHDLKVRSSRRSVELRSAWWWSLPDGPDAAKQLETYQIELRAMDRNECSQPVVGSDNRVDR